MSVIIGAFIAIVAAVGGGIAAKFGERLLDFLSHYIGSRRHREPSFGSFFHGVYPGHSDLCVFTLTARSHLPIMDLVYLEFLRMLLLTDKVSKVALAIWHPDEGNELFGAADDSVWTSYDKYLGGLFASFGSRVRLVSEVELDAEGVRNKLPPLFWRSLAKLSDPEYYRWVRNIGVRARKVIKVQEMTRARAGELHLRNLVAHAIRNTELCRIVIEELQTERGDRQNAEPVVSVLFWELDADRLAVFFELYDAGREGRSDVPRFTLNPIAGGTVRGRRGVVSDNHSAHSALSAFSRLGEQIAWVQERSRTELRRYHSAVAVVLKENYGFSEPRAKWRVAGTMLVDGWSIAERLDHKPRLGRDGYEFLYLWSSLVERQKALRAPVESVG